MTHAEFEALVSRLELLAVRAPRTYRLRVALLACLGYTSLFVVLLLLLLIIGGIALMIALTQHPVLLLKLLFGPVALAATLLKSIQVSMPEPEGSKVTRQEAPALFALLDDLQTTLKAPRFQSVLLTRELNAGVVQVPRFGLLGWQKNFLLLGLPLMQALSPEEFKAVAAHEEGHLSGSHGRFGGYIHRLRLMWTQVLDNLRQDKHRSASAWMGRFFAWYAPYFSAYTFVLARQHEYEADRCAAEVAGAGVMAQALISLQVHGRFWEEQFWPSIQKQAEDAPVPPPVFGTLTQAFQSRLLPEDAQRFLSHALSQKTSTADTHPSLADRLSGLGCLQRQATRPQAGVGTAASFYLDAAEHAQEARLDEEWQQKITAKWHACYQQAQEGRQALADLNVIAQSRPLQEKEHWNQAHLTAEYGAPALAAEMFRQIVLASPSHPEAHLSLGHALLKLGDAAGLEHLQTAMQLEPDLILTASQAAFRFCRQQGREADAEAFRRQATARRYLLFEAQQEREEIGDKAEFEPSGLPPAVLADLSRQMQGVREIKSAFLVRKKLRHLPEHPLYVLWLVPPVVCETKPAGIVRKVLSQLKFDGHTQVRVTDGSHLQLLKLRRAVKTAQFYRRARK